ncbi:hypothetical protein [[Limnothrix rosea] IAM M-220]|uniref:hypothetical protein n=1 Tax=[Limnothrix rosea] IAM M-220 TaxID=454133 RepID=UPI001CEDD8CD|nr:hypothetical protein [[Limnothrix rosea] IAM M-220]
MIEFPWLNDQILPVIPISLSCSNFTISANALLDTGSTVNVLPYDLGLQLGAIWEDQKVSIPLAGNLAKTEAKGLFVELQLQDLEPVRLAFAWAKTSQLPLILGQTNFFQEFDVCFQRSSQSIKVTLRR